MGNTTQDRGSSAGPDHQANDGNNKILELWYFTGVKSLYSDDKYLSLHCDILLQFWNIGKFPESDMIPCCVRAGACVGRE